MRAEEKLNRFKEQAKGYQNCFGSIRKLDEHLALIQTKMENVHSPNLEIGGSSVSDREKQMIALIEQKDVLEKKKKYYKDQIHWIESVVDSVSSTAAKLLIWMTYIQRRSLNSIAEEYDLQKNTLYLFRKKHLIRALTAERMSELDHILTQFPECIPKKTGKNIKSRQPIDIIN